MILDLELLKNILIIALASGCVTTLTIQKVKEFMTKKTLVCLAGFLVSMIIGTLFAKSFSSANWIYSVWCGFFTWIDANLLYSALEDKIFTKFSDLQPKEEIIEIER